MFDNSGFYERRQEVVKADPDNGWKIACCLTIVCCPCNLVWAVLDACFPRCTVKVEPAVQAPATN
jgi:hypothetical protein